MPYRAKKLTPINTSSLDALGQSVIDLSKWTEDEFAQVAKSWTSIDAENVLYTPPPKPRRGTIVYADGTHWNPGYGEGPYYYNGSAWLPMNASAVIASILATNSVSSRVRLISANQPFTASTVTKVKFDTVDYDPTGSWVAANFNFKPQVAGTYLITGTVSMTGTFSAGSTIGDLYVGKNGLYTTGAPGQLDHYLLSPGPNAISLSGSTLVQLNGTTDTVEVDVQCTGTSPVLQNVGWRTMMAITRVSN
jgi:hypothetical protein